MRLSIWQQFSSNHSATFTVVGTFDSDDDAQRATNELKDIVNKLQKWWDQLDPNERELWNSRAETEEISPIEKELGDKYQVDWPFHLGWFGWVWDFEPVQQFDNHILIHHPHYLLT